MSKRQFLCLLGVWVMVFLFLGFPSGWHRPIALVSGLIIIVIAYNLPAAVRPISTSSSTGSSSPETFVENKQQ